MRKRNARKSRSTLQLDFRKLYVAGVSPDLFRTIETPLPGENEFEVQFCEDILHSHPGYFEVMVLLGDAYTRKGDYQKCLELDLRLTRIRPENNLVRYNLACSYALTGQKEKAINCLIKAVSLGYQDIEHMRQDHDLDAVKSDPRFQALVKRLAEDQHETRSLG